MANLLEHLKTDVDRIADTINPDTTNPMESNLDRIANKLNTTATDPMMSNLDKIAEGVESGGGSGSSEQFKIATVSITYTGNNTLGVYIPITDAIPITPTNPDETKRIIQPMTMFDTEESSATFDIVVPINGVTMLFTGYSFLKQSQVTITGDAVYQGGTINISGDCEISISD